MDRMNGTDEVTLVETDCTCASRVENNHEVIRSDRDCTFGEIAMQHKEHDVQILCLVEWESSCRWIEIRCGNQNILLVTANRMRDGSWVSNAFTSSHEQVRANSMGYFQNKTVPVLDDCTGVPSHLHDEENE